MDEKKARIRSFFAVCLLLFGLLVIRLFYLQILKHDFYVKRSHAQRTRIIDRAAQRGDIYDRNGNLLATTIDTYSVFTYEKGAFKWLNRKLPKVKAQEICQKDPVNIGMLDEKKRIYPKNRMVAQVIGFCGTDNNGLSGIELSLDEWLKGKEGRIVTEGDPQGRELYGAIRNIEQGSDGCNVYLTIDNNIQYIAEKEIKKQMERSKAIGAMAIVMDAKTGEILALASEPGFDANDYKKAGKKNWHPRFLDPYEPGSTFKVLTTAAALDEGVAAMDTMLNALDTITVGGKVINNSHQVHWPGKMITISKMLEESINTAVVQLGLKLGPEKFYKKIKDFGFGQTVGIGLYGESRGILRHYSSWYKPDIAMMCFGQSIAVTPLQLLSAFSAFANNGTIVKPYLIKKVEGIDSPYVKINTREERGHAISNKTAQEGKQLMRNVVVRGSGKRAAIEGFGVMGKTGTAQKADPAGRGYLKGHYIASFIGLAPYNQPKLICLIIVDDPKGGYWGESVCGPVFKNIVEYSLRYLNEKPDVI